MSVFQNSAFPAAGIPGKRLRLGAVARQFGVSPDRLRQIHAEDPIPGVIPGRRQLEWWENPELLRRASDKITEKKRTRNETAWKYGWRPPHQGAGFDTGSALFGDLPGVRAEGPGLDLSGVAASDREHVFTETGARLQLCSRSLSWWWGDYLVSYQEFYGEIPFHLEKSHGRCMQVAKFFPREFRHAELSFKHHEVATRLYLGNLGAALAALNRAHAEGQTPRDMELFSSRAG